MLHSILILLFIQSGFSYFYDGSGCTDVALRYNLPCSVKSGNITVFTVTDSTPFVARVGNGVPYGFDIDLLNYLGFVYRINFNYQYVNFQDLIPRVSNNPNSISISTQTITTARMEFVDFAQFFKTGTGFLAKASYTGRINGLSDLCGKKVGVINGSTHQNDAINQNTKCPSNNKITIVAVLTQTETTQIVLDGTVDVSLRDQAGLVTIVRESNGQLKTVGTPYNVQPYGILCNKNSDALCCALVNGINYLIQEGIYEDLLVRYGFSYKNNGVCPSRINLQGSTCEDKCTPSKGTCKNLLN